MSIKQQQDNTKAGHTFYPRARNKSCHIGSFWNKIVIFINDGFNAEMHAKLRYDNLKQKYLIKQFILGYINDDPLIKEFIMKMNKKKFKKSSMKKTEKQKNEQNQIIYDFGLDENDIASIFDEIEKENPET